MDIDDLDIDVIGEEEYYKLIDIEEERAKLSPKYKIITYPLTQDTCWFNALIVSIFYSKYSRDLLIDSLNELF